MLEESIDSSPNNFDSSIHRKREHRKAKRRRLNELLQRSDPLDEQQLLRMYCDDSEHEESIAIPTHNNTFKRFQAENLMANADRFDVPCKVKKVPELTQQTQEFCTCERLLELGSDTAQTSQDHNMETNFLSCQSIVENAKDNFDSAWILEAFEDEMPLQTDNYQTNDVDERILLDRTLVPNACDKTITAPTAHREHNTAAAFFDCSPTDHVKNKTIVETILEDFCSSLDSTESECIEVDAEEAMPFFRFRRKRIRTYERFWRRSNKNVATICKSDVDCLSDGSNSSSELSVQEDKSQVIPTVEPLEHFNTSKTIQNNLLNLSAFFTQNLVDSNDSEKNCPRMRPIASEKVLNTDTVAAQIPGNENSIGQPIKETFTLNAKYPISSEFENNGFHGFPSKRETTDDGGTSVTEPQKCNIVSRSAPTLLENYMSLTCPSDAVVDHQASFDEDSWHLDNDFFANFQTQAVHRNVNTDVKRPRRKSDSTLQLATPRRNSRQANESNVTTQDTNGSLNNANRQLPEPIASTKLSDSTILLQIQCPIKIENDTVESQIPVEDILKFFDSPQTTSASLQVSTKKHEVPKVLESDFDCMVLSEWPLDEKESDLKKHETAKISSLTNRQPKNRFHNDQTEIIQFRAQQVASSLAEDAFLMPQSIKEKTRTSNVNMSFEGFQTASRKVIHISEEAREKVNSIFAQLPDLPSEKSIPTSRCTVSDEKRSVQLPNKPKNETGTTDCFRGFETASRKVIHISEEAREKVDSIFARLPDLPGEKNIPTSRCTVSEEKRSVQLPSKPKSETETTDCFRGFETASRKAIHISEEAREKVDSIFARLPNLPGKKTATSSPGILRTENMPIQLPESRGIDNIKETRGATFSTGFQTASRKGINVSEDARGRINNIYANLPVLPSEKAENPSRSAMKVNSISTYSSASRTDNNTKRTGDATCLTGFQTAATRKAMTATEEAQKKIDSLFAQLLDLPNEKIESTFKNTSKVENRYAQLPVLPNEKLNKKPEAGTFSTGFETASRKAITVTEGARKKVDSIFAQLPDLPAEKSESTPLATMKAETMPVQSTQLLRQNNTNEKGGATCFTGFQTASRNAINVSEEAQKKIDTVFAQLPDLPGENTKRSSLQAINISNEAGTKSEMVSKNSTDIQKGVSNKNIKTRNYDTFEDLTNIPLSEWIPNSASPQSKQFVTNKAELDMAMKRKLHSVDNAQPAKILCKSHTVNENSKHTSVKGDCHSEVKTTLSHVSNSKSNGRINLLSLTKRRRESVRMESNVQNTAAADFIETPVKVVPAVCPSKNIGTPHTPQASDFYAHLPTAASTPQQFNVVKTSAGISKHSIDNLDFDFKRINWENTDEYHSNDHLNTTPIRTDSSGLNKSLKPQPSPQERIENLSSCGDPPPLMKLVDSSNRSRNLGMSRRRRICAKKK